MIKSSGHTALFGLSYLMKKIYLILILLTAKAFGQTMALSLCWDPNPEPDVTLYKVYTSLEPGAREHSFMVTDSITTTATIADLTIGAAYHFQVTALNTAGLESDPSNELTYFVPGISMPSPGVIRFLRAVKRENVDYVLQASELVTGPYLDEPFEEEILDDTRQDGLELVEYRSLISTPTRFFRLFLRINPIGCAAQ